MAEHSATLSSDGPDFVPGDNAAERRSLAKWYAAAKLALARNRPLTTATTRRPLCANVRWNTCLLEFTVQGSITHGSSTGIFDEPRSVKFDPGHPVRSP